MKNKSKKIDVIKFEVLKTSGEVLKGGFSSSFSSQTFGGTNINVPCSTNNCKGGNCSAKCGKDPIGPLE